MRKPSDVIHIAIRHADETVGIMAFVTCEYGPKGEVAWEVKPTKKNVDAVVAQMEQALDADKRPVKGWRIVDSKEVADLNKDRTYRDAWRHSPSKGFSHDMDHAREIHRDLLRAARAPKLDELDVAYQRADEAGDDKAKERIAAEKQALRDVTEHPAIENANTPEALKKAWPKELRDG